MEGWTILSSKTANGSPAPKPRSPYGMANKPFGIINTGVWTTRKLGQSPDIPDIPIGVAVAGIDNVDLLGAISPSSRRLACIASASGLGNTVVASGSRDIRLSPRRS